MTDLRIRLATEGDCAETLPKLARQTFSDTFGHLYPPEELEAYLSSAYEPSVLREEVRNPKNRLWIIEDQFNAAVAYVQVGPCGLPHPEASPLNFELKRMYIIKEYQARGLGRRLMELALEWALNPASGFTGPLWVGVYSENPRAQALYSRYGFSKYGEYEFIVGKMRDKEFIFRKERA